MKQQQHDEASAQCRVGGPASPCGACNFVWHFQARICANSSSISSPKAHRVVRAPIEGGRRVAVCILCVGEPLAIEVCTVLHVVARRLAIVGGSLHSRAHRELLSKCSAGPEVLDRAGRARETPGHLRCIYLHLPRLRLRGVGRNGNGENGSLRGAHAQAGIDYSAKRMSGRHERGRCKRSSKHLCTCSPLRSQALPVSLSHALYSLVLSGENHERACEAKRTWCAEGAWAGMRRALSRVPVPEEQTSPPLQPTLQARLPVQI